MLSRVTHPSVSMPASTPPHLHEGLERSSAYRKSARLTPSPPLPPSMVAWMAAWRSRRSASLMSLTDLVAGHRSSPWHSLGIHRRMGGAQAQQP